MPVIDFIDHHAVYDFNQDCEFCYNVYHCRDCAHCSNCYGCDGLYNKHYCINNEQYSSVEYWNILNSN